MLRVLLQHKGSSNPHSIMENHVNLETIAKTRAGVVCCVRMAHGCVLGWACCVTCFLRYSVCCLPSQSVCERSRGRVCECAGVQRGAAARC